MNYIKLTLSDLQQVRAGNETINWFLSKYPEGETPLIEWNWQSWLKLNTELSEANPAKNSHLWLGFLTYKGMLLPSFENAFLTRKVIVSALLYCANFSRAKMFESSFLDSNFSESKFVDAGIARAKFTRCNFIGANFFRAVLTGAKFTECNLKNCNFSGADLRIAKLKNCILTGAVFKNAMYDKWAKFPQGFEPEKEGMILWEGKSETYL